MRNNPAEPLLHSLNKNELPCGLESRDLGQECTVLSEEAVNGGSL